MMKYTVTYLDIDNCYEREEWACVNCESFRRLEIIDVSDVSLIGDTVFDFSFTNEEDATWFKLRWS